MSEQTIGNQNREALKQIENNAEADTSQLHINRVPNQTIDNFKENAHDRWAGDYGMYLAYLLEIDKLRTQYDRKFTATTEKVAELQEEVRELKQELGSDEKQDEKESKVSTIG